jgi:hypothetical protein
MTENTPNPGEAIMATNPRPLPTEMAPLTTEPNAGEKLFETGRGRPFWRQQKMTILVAAAVSALVATVISGGGWLFRDSGSAQILKQQGNVNISAGNSQEVFYPIAYASPPYLHLDGDANWQFVKLLEQKADHFKINCTAQFGSAQIRWQAEGVRKDR